MDQNHGLTPLKKCQFFDFLNFFFLWLRKAFFCSRISSKTFSWPILPKNKSRKNGHFWTKTMGWLFGKNGNFSPVWTSCFYTTESRFIALECRKRYFTGVYCLKTKVGKRAIFGPKPWVNPFGKIFWTFSFYSLKRRYLALEYRKRHFPVLYCLKKKVGKMANFGPKPWVNPSRIMSTVRLFKLLVLIG